MRRPCLNKRRYSMCSHRDRANRFPVAMAQQPDAPDQQEKTVMPRLPVLPARHPVTQLFAACRPLHIMHVISRTSMQRCASINQIYTLHRAEGRYYLEPAGYGNPLLGPETSLFLFVILAEEPDTIYCAAATPVWPNPVAVEGHTSISLRQPVLYAGHLRLLNGNLLYWTNSSGHYQPDAKYHVNNLHPYVRRLLPSALFDDY